MSYVTRKSVPKSGAAIAKAIFVTVLGYTQFLVFQIQSINNLDLNRAETYRPLWILVFAAGKLGFSILEAQTSDQHRHHDLNKSKHGLFCFVVSVPCSAKLSCSFPKQYYNSQNVAAIRA